MKIGIEIEFFAPIGKYDLASKLRNQGIAVEATSYTHAVSSNWKIVDDGSVYGMADHYGMELVSPILNSDSDADMATVRRICRAVQKLGGRVNKACGLHIHVDATDLTAAQVLQVWTRYQTMEGEIDTLMTSNRRANLGSYCQSLRNLMVHGQTKEALARSADRYFKVNLQSLNRHGTIEFRQHSGTINADTIINWASFCVGFVEASLVNPGTRIANRTETTTVHPTGLNTGMLAIYRALLQAPHHNMTVAEIALSTGLGENSVRAYISTMHTRHGVNVRHAYRGSCNIVLTPVTTTRTIAASEPTADTIWRGIDPATVAFYMERAQELAGFASR